MLMLHVGIALMAVIVGFQAIASYELPLFLETLESTKHLWRGAPALPALSSADEGHLY